MFPLNSQPEYNLRNKTHFATRPIRTVYYGDKSIRYLGPKLWELIPSNIKDTESDIQKSHTEYQTTAHGNFAKLTFTKLVSYDSNGFFIYIYKLFYFCYMQRCFSEPCKTSRMELIYENTFDCFRKRLHLGCLTELLNTPLMYFCFSVSQCIWFFVYVIG